MFFILHFSFQLKKYIYSFFKYLAKIQVKENFEKHWICFNMSWLKENRSELSMLHFPRPKIRPRRRKMTSAAGTGRASRIESDERKMKILQPERASFISQSRCGLWLLELGNMFAEPIVQWFIQSGRCLSERTSPGAAPDSGPLEREMSRAPVIGQSGRLVCVTRGITPHNVGSHDR